MTHWELAKAKLGLKGDKGMCRCPAHNDTVASLSARRNGDDIDLTCFSGCDFRAVRAALGLGPKQTAHATPKPHRPLTPTLEAVHRYTDLDGVVVAEKRRLRMPDGTKQTPWCSLDDTGTMRPGLGGRKLETLNLYNVVAASFAVRELGAILMCPEGEACVDRLTEIGLTAVTLPEGASGARSAYESLWRWDAFPHGTPVCLMPDNDEAGEKHVRRLADVLSDRFDVSVLRFPELGPKDDVADWIKSKRALNWSHEELADELHYRALHAMPHVASPYADVLGPHTGLIGPNPGPNPEPNTEPNTAPNPEPNADLAEAVTERAAILADANAWPLDACERIARAQVGARVARERATLTPAQRLALETTDPELRDIYATLAAMSG